MVKYIVIDHVSVLTEVDKRKVSIMTKLSLSLLYGLQYVSYKSLLLYMA